MCHLAVLRRPLEGIAAPVCALARNDMVFRLLCDKICVQGAMRGIAPLFGSMGKRNYSSIMDILFLVTSRTPVVSMTNMPKKMNMVVPVAPVSGSIAPDWFWIWKPEVAE